MHDDTHGGSQLSCKPEYSTMKTALVKYTNSHHNEIFHLNKVRL